MKENKTKLAIIISFLALIGTVGAQVRERYTTPTIDSLRRVYEHEFDEDDFDFSSTNVILIPAKDPNKIPFYDPNGNPTTDPNLYYDPNNDTLFVINIDVNGLTLADLTAIRLVFTDSNNTLASVTDLTAWIAGTTDHISFVDDGDGTGTINLDTNTRTLLGSFNGIFLEKLDFTISEAGGTVTGTLEQESGGDLIQKFSDGYTVLDCTPAKTIDLTAYVGTNAVPKEVFIYILRSAKTTIVASNVDWPLDPEVEHIKIAHLVLKSAVTTGTDGGALMNQNHNDYAFDATGEGHIQDIEHRLRQEPAAYHSGVALTLKNSGGTELTTGNSSTAVELVTATGHVFQIHRHSFPAFDMYTEATDKADIVNQPADEGGNYETTTDLVTDVTHYVDGTAAGVTIGTNKYFNLVIWGVMNRDGEVSFLMINLPTSQYTKSANAIADVDGTSIFEIPSAFKGTGFLIARLTFRLIGGSQWTYIAQEDLRGKFPDIIAGVGITTTDHALLANLIAPADDHTQYLLADGTRALAGAWDMGSQVLTNVNIDSGVITGITPLAIADGGTSQGTAQLAINALSAVSGATNEHVLTKDTGTGNATWKVSIGGGGGSGTMTTVKEGNVQVGGADQVTIDFGPGFDVTEDPDTETNIVLDFTELTGNKVWNDNATDASTTWTYALSGANDPVWTIGANSMDLTTGALKVGGSAVLTAGANDQKAGVDAGATPDYVGAAAGDGFLRTGAPLTYVDGGDFVTLGVDVSKDIVAGAGLSGGENDVLVGADADTTLNLDINGQTEQSDPNDATDYLVFYDAGAGSFRKVKISDVTPILDKCKLRRDAAQSIPSGAWTKIAFDAEEIDIGGIGDIATNNRVDISNTTHYRITVSSGVESAIDGGELWASGIYIDGGLVKRSLGYAHGAVGSIFGIVSDVYYLTSGQYVEMYVIHTDNTAQNTSTTVYDRPVLSVVQLQ